MNAMVERPLVTRQRVMFVLELLVNIAAPWAVYTWAKPHVGEVHAIMLSALPPMVWSLVDFARRRVVDALSVLVLGGIALSLVGYAFGGSPKLLLMRESLVTGLIGVVFLGSVVVRRPLVYVLAKAAVARQSGEEQAAFRAEAESPRFRRMMGVITAVWGCALVAETGVRAGLLFSIPVSRFLVVGPVVGYGTVGLLMLWTFLYARGKGV
jgi:hypothetical protein